MAAPTFVAAGAGVADAASPAFTPVITFGNGLEAGDVVILQVFQDGPTAGIAVDFTTPGNTNLEALDGTDDAMTFIGSFSVGSTDEALQHLWIGRSQSTALGAGTISGYGSEDVFMRMYAFRGVSTGTALADVIENGSAGGTANQRSTSTTVADSGVTTLGADRLAVNFVAVNDDNVLDAFTGQSGGTWTEAVAEYADSAGTDGAIGLQIAEIASAGTINGGTDTMAAADAYGVVGFALIPADSFTTHNIAAAENFGPGIVTAVGRETFIAIPDPLGLDIVTALSRQTFIASDVPLGPTIDTSLSPVIKVLAADMALNMVIDTALTRQTFIAAAENLGLTIDSALRRETFLSAAENFGPSIVTALSRETFISLVENLGVDISVDLTVTQPGGTEHFIASDFPLNLQVDSALGRETFISAAHNLGMAIATAVTRETFLSADTPLNLTIDVVLRRETFVSADMNLAFDFASRLVQEMFVSAGVPLGNDIYINLTIAGQEVIRNRLLLGAGK